MVLSWRNLSLVLRFDEVRRFLFCFSQFMDSSLVTDTEICIPAASLTVTLNVSARISNDNH